jgi:hypothetical protein
LFADLKLVPLSGDGESIGELSQALHTKLVNDLDSLFQEVAGAADEDVVNKLNDLKTGIVDGLARIQAIEDKYLAVPPPGPPSPGGANRFLFNQLQTNTDPRLARIYAAAYEGELYFLPKPYVFLVHGPGRKVREPDLTTTIDEWGVAAKFDRFADDVRVWFYDKEDFSLRIDIISGVFNEILLEPLLVGDQGITSRADMTSRANMSARANMSSRADMTSRADMSARADMTARHRFQR